jgi:uncharacterized protein
LSLYLDTNIVIPLFVAEQRSQEILRWIGQQSRLLFVADLAATEVNAAISRLVREGEFDEVRAAEIRNQFEIWCAEAAEPLENTPADIRAAGQMVSIALPKLLAADAIHLATCRRLGLTLVTNDAALLEIAKREGVEAFGVRTDGGAFGGNVT